jgi:K(+)-stimulated pyrophosphate-energized sodium pump
LIIGTAITIAHQYANIYGVAIAGAGLTAVTGASAAVSSLSIISATSASILNAADDDINDNTADILDTCSIRARSSANAFTVTASAITAFALYFAYSNAAEQHTVDILNPKVILSLMLGAGTALLLYGLTIVAVRVTGRVALRDLDRSDETEGTTSSLRGSLLPTILTIIFPLIAGLLLGKGGLSAYLAGALITGTFLMISSNNSGQHFEHTAVNTLGPIIKVMIAVAIAFLPLFTKMGSFIF